MLVAFQVMVVLLTVSIYYDEPKGFSDGDLVIILLMWGLSTPALIQLVKDLL